MNVFKEKVKIGIVKNGEFEFLEEIEMIVDTGSHLTSIPEDVVQSCNLPILGEIEVKLSDGRKVKKKWTYVALEVRGKRTVSPVTICLPEGIPVLGSISLEAMGLAVDPVNKKLIPVDIFELGGLCVG